MKAQYEPLTDEQLARLKAAATRMVEHGFCEPECDEPRCTYHVVGPDTLALLTEHARLAELVRGLEAEVAVLRDVTGLAMEHLITVGPCDHIEDGADDHECRYPTCTYCALNRGVSALPFETKQACNELIARIERAAVEAHDARARAKGDANG